MIFKCRHCGKELGYESLYGSTSLGFCKECCDRYNYYIDKVFDIFAIGHDVKITPIYKLDGLAEKCKERRLELGLSMEQLAEKAGVSRWTIINLEQGKRLKPETIELIVKALELEV